MTYRLNSRQFALVHDTLAKICSMFNSQVFSIYGYRVECFDKSLMINRKIIYKYHYNNMANRYVLSFLIVELSNNCIIHKFHYNNSVRKYVLENACVVDRSSILKLYNVGLSRKSDTKSSHSVGRLALIITILAISGSFMLAYKRLI